MRITQTSGTKRGEGEGARLIVSHGDLYERQLVREGAGCGSKALPTTRPGDK